MVLNKVLITGSSGMVGRHLVDKFLSENARVVGSSRRPFSGHDGKIDWLPWNLSEWRTESQLDAMFPGVEAVIHAGASVPKSGNQDSNKNQFDTNVRNCYCLGSWAQSRGLPFTFISGAIVYQDTSAKGIKENAPLSQNGSGSFYGFSKFLGERIFGNLATEGLELCILRPTSIYGYGLSEEKMISKFLQILSVDECLNLSPPFDDKFDFIHASSVAEAAFKVFQSDSRGTFNISGGETVTISDLAETCRKVVGRGSINLLGEDHTLAGKSIYDLNTDAARSAFGYSPNLTLFDGLTEMWAAMREEKV